MRRAILELIATLTFVPVALVTVFALIGRRGTGFEVAAYVVGLACFIYLMERKSDVIFHGAP